MGAARHLLPVAFLGALAGLGIRSLATGDPRFGWGMFKELVDYSVSYAWVTGAGTLEPYMPGPELQGEARVLDGSRWRIAAYSVKSVHSGVRPYLNHLARDRAPAEARAIRAVLFYRVNRQGPFLREVLEVRVPQPQGAGLPSVVARARPGRVEEPWKGR